MIRILDGYCGGGGAATGMIQAGAFVTGIDLLKKCARYYPGRFMRGNVLGIEKWTQLSGEPFTAQFDLLWFSPPCQGYSPMTNVKGSNENHPKLIQATRELAKRLGKPYIIENVEGAADQLVDPIMLCGYMFKLKLQRHRFFECSFPVKQPEHPDHDSIPEGMKQPFSVVGNPPSSPRKGIVYAEVVRSWPEQMGITHIPPGSRLFAEAIPPAFSRFLVESFIKWRENP